MLVFPNGEEGFHTIQHELSPSSSGSFAASDRHIAHSDEASEVSCEMNVHCCSTKPVGERHRIEVRIDSSTRCILPIQVPTPPVSQASDAPMD